MNRTLAGHVAALGLVTAMLPGCGGDASEGRPRAAATATAASLAGERVRFRATDGRRVSGRYVAADEPDAPGLVLLHEQNGSAGQWAPHVAMLHDAGYATLAYESRSSPLEGARLPDATGAVRRLRRQPGVDPDRIGLVGVNIGASTAVLASATAARSTADAVVAISPRASADVWELQDEARYRPHDVLFVHDAGEAINAENLFDGAVRSKAMQSAQPGHGLVLLGEERVRTAILDWLDDRVK